MMDCLNENEAEDQGLTFQQKAAAKHQKMKDGKKKAVETKQKNEEARLRKAPNDNIPSGLTSAIHEWARALLGLPRQSTSPNSSQIDVSKVTQHHLPKTAEVTEVEAWSNHNKSRSDFIEFEINQKMAQKLTTNPKASLTYKAELKKAITKEVVAQWGKKTPPGKFISRVAQTTASIQSYERTRLAIAEASLASAGFPRCTLQWTNAINTPWNSAMLNTLLNSWLECYYSKGVPSCYDIPESDETPKLAKEILTKWLTHKRARYNQEEKDKTLLATPEGARKYVKKVVETKERRAMKALRKQLAETRTEALAKHITDFTATHKLLLVMDKVHSETESVPATKEKPAHRRRIKLAWRTAELDKLIFLADKMAKKKKDLTQAQKTNVTRAQAARKEYSTATVDPEAQLPPKGFPKCLIREEYLHELGELEVEALELSEDHIELNTLNEHLMKKLGNKSRMAVLT
ncbi:uncharacterized protein MELLADRAFT_84102 [Melampsora larici-populina 98AG31]|uniref:Uncharacterized protein n=1 Tax=Melampsora larici-populina (strain 98AG31 / pathotype 3-4-7) TaxID=747676 RepID=F4SBI1_MELLP|nr:uncharacterized protein MELLADRAFT_84102 [Melampsora larici-populina 98AG31]EGF97993.1 hypothetical protein MELLADRAFT_84102 [Melampsora larici-populina 98AG31]